MSKNLRPTRYSALSLKDVICLCAGPPNDEAWEEFVSRVGEAIALAVLRTAALWGERSRSLVEDLVQMTYVKLWEDNCRLLRDFAVQYPEAVLGYVKKTAANLTHDYFRHAKSQSAGGNTIHVPANRVEAEAGRESQGSQEQIAFAVFLKQIDEHLKRCLIGPDHARDRMIFWLYFQQGMSAKEIAAMPSIGLGPKGVGSVIERVKQSIREQIIRNPDDDRIYQDLGKSKLPQKVVKVQHGPSVQGTSDG
jgi:RNA polymerase sigma factor (sigma-70 family)